MTRTAAGWRVVQLSYARNAAKAEDTAARFDAMSQHASAKEDVLVRDAYAEAAARARADAEFWIDHAARAEAYALDAELPVTLTVVRQQPDRIAVGTTWCGSFTDHSTHGYCLGWGRQRHDDAGAIDCETSIVCALLVLSSAVMAAAGLLGWAG